MGPTMSANRYRIIEREARDMVARLVADGRPYAVAIQLAAEWEIAEVRRESGRVRAALDLMRSEGTRVYAERNGITQRSAQRRRQSMLNEKRREVAT